jgi:CheY-like chemotaxis protein
LARGCAISVEPAYQKKIETWPRFCANICLKRRNAPDGKPSCSPVAKAPAQLTVGSAFLIVGTRPKSKPGEPKMSGKILLADDSITIQKVVNLTFADEGIEVVAVSNGEVAEKRLSEINPDLVLADIFMPGKSGYELCHYIKQSPQFKHIPVVLLVGAFEPFDKAEADRVGADAHLTKPFESRALVETVHRLIQKSRSTEAKPHQVLMPESEVGPEVAVVDSFASSEPIAIDFNELGQPEIAFSSDTAQVPPDEQSAPLGFDLQSDSSSADLSAIEQSLQTSEAADHLTTDSFEASRQGRGCGVPSIFAQSSQEVVLDFDRVETIPTPAVEMPSFEIDSAAQVTAPPSTLDEEMATSQLLAEDEPLGDFFAGESAPIISCESILESPPALEQGVGGPVASEHKPSCASDQLPEPALQSGETTGFTSSEMWAEEARFSPVDIENATGFDLVEPTAESSNFDAVSHEPAPSELIAESFDFDIASATKVSHAEASEAVSAVEAARKPPSGADLSPEAIDEIVRRVIEQMSDSVIREIAWEVVPDCVERVVERLTRESLSKR